MTTTSESKDLRNSSTIDNPGDIPTARLPALTRLDALVGEWEMEACFEADYFAPGSPPVTARGGRTTFEWLVGGFFLIQRFAVDNPAAPSGIAIIGAAADLEMFTQHYYDSRSSSRLPDESRGGRLEAVAGRAGILATLRRSVLVRRHEHHRRLGGLARRKRMDP